MPEATHETVLEATGSRARLARVYAESLLALAQKAGQADEVGGELNAVAFDVVGKNPRVAEFLDSPANTAKRKLPVLAAAFEKSTSDLFKKFVGVLNQHNRLGLLRDVASAYQGIRDKQAGRVRVLVRAATPLSDAQRNDLTATLKTNLSKEPILNVRVEPELLGGLIVHVGDRVYDTSVRTRLESLRNHLMASSSHGA
jgi:F-type H+-transporting ATPase subunit delta